MENDVSLWQEYHPNDFPLSIDKVIEPIFNGYKLYVESIR